MKKIAFRLFFVALVICQTTIAFSQSAKHRIISLPVQRNGITVPQPWTGALNAPQFSPIDLNHDAYTDLFVFDRIGDKVLTFINTGANNDNAYQYAPQYEALFPDSLLFNAFIRDYNHDNIPDIFTFISTGTRVYKGGMVNGQLHFELVSPLLTFYEGGFYKNIYTRNGDNSVYVDVNADGDIDVLTPNGFSGSTVEYYENQTMEHQGDPHFDVDSLQYSAIDYCWGGFTEAPAHSVSLGSCKGAGGGHAGDDDASRDLGTTISAFDYGRDGDVDLLIGQISYNNLLFVENCGDTGFAQVCRYDSVFPACSIVPAAVPAFPAAYALDVTNDGIEDVLVAPNARTGIRDIKNVLLFKQTGDVNCPFQYQSDSFLVQHMLDYGTESKPYFVDISGDGLLDIVIGNYGYYRPFQTYKSTLAYLQNTGTAAQPAFTEQSTDLFNVSGEQLIGVHPAFGDLTGDGKPDMVLGDQNGYLYFAKNTGTGAAAFPDIDSTSYFQIDAGQFSTPFIYDVNGDQLNDLVVGKKDGKLSYYWNFGTTTNALFHRDSVNSSFGQINVTEQGFTDGSSSPFITKENGVMKLYTGCTRGLVFKYDINPNNLRGGSFTLVSSNYIKHDPGIKSTISVADIDNDGNSEYLIGNARGGLMLFSDSVWDPGTELALDEIPVQQNLLKVYPNPAGNYFVCALTGINFTNPKVEVITVLGEKTNAEVSVSAGKIVVNTAALNTGLYIVQIYDAGKIYTAKVLVSR